MSYLNAVEKCMATNHARSTNSSLAQKSESEHKSAKEHSVPPKKAESFFAISANKNKLRCMTPPVGGAKATKLLRQTSDEFDPSSFTFKDLFLGDLDAGVTEAQILTLFKQYGKVEKIDIKRHKGSGKSMGYGFVTMGSAQSARACRLTLDNYPIGGKPIKVRWAEPNTNLFVGDLDPAVTTDMLKDIFRIFGPIYEHDTHVKKGKYGFVRFKSRKNAERAKREMDGKVMYGRRLRIGWGEASPQRNTVHISFPARDSHLLSDFMLRTIFANFGDIEAVSLPPLKSIKCEALRGPSLAFGLVTYKEDDSGDQAAARAIEVMHEKEINGVTIQCSFGKRRAKTLTGRDSSESDCSRYSVQEPRSPKRMSRRRRGSRGSRRGGRGKNRERVNSQDSDSQKSLHSFHSNGEGNDDKPPFEYVTGLASSMSQSSDSSNTASSSAQYAAQHPPALSPALDVQTGAVFVPKVVPHYTYAYAPPHSPAPFVYTAVAPPMMIPNPYPHVGYDLPSGGPAYNPMMYHPGYVYGVGRSTTHEVIDRFHAHDPFFSEEFKEDRKKSEQLPPSRGKFSLSGQTTLYGIDEHP